MKNFGFINVFSLVILRKVYVAMPSEDNHFGGVLYLLITPLYKAYFKSRKVKVKNLFVLVAVITPDNLNTKK